MNYIEIDSYFGLTGYWTNGLSDQWAVGTSGYPLIRSLSLYICTLDEHFVLTMDRSDRNVQNVRTRTRMSKPNGKEVKILSLNFILW